MSIKITVETKLLRAAIDRVAALPGVSSNPSPSAGMVKLSSGMDGLTMTRISQDSMITVSIPCDVGDEGDVYVGHANLSNVVSRFNGQFVSISIANQSLILKSDKSNASVAMVDGELFPNEPDEDMANTVISTDAEKFREWLSICSPAASHGQSRPNLEGVAIRKIDNQLAFVATDGRRLHLALTGMEGDEDVTIPNETVDALEKILDGVKGPAKILISDNIVRVRAPDIELRSTLSAEKMPGIHMVTNPPASDLRHWVKVKRDEFLCALRSTAGIANILTFRVGKLSTVIDARQSEIQLKETVDSDCSEEFEFMVPGNQTVIALQKCTSDNIRIDLTTNFMIVTEDDRRVVICLVREQEKK